jgi:hypothetical protein
MEIFKLAEQHLLGPIHRFKMERMSLDHLYSAF